MHTTKLHRILARLDRGEQSAFARYVEALGGKNRDELGRMAQLFVDKALAPGSISKPDFYARMAWPPPFNPGLLNNRLSDLKKKLEQFLAIRALAADPAASAAMLMRALDARGWPDLLKAESAHARATLDDAPADISRYLNQLQIEDSLLAATMEAPRKFKEPAFDQPIQSLDDFFCLQKLRYACAALTFDRSFNTRHDLGMIAEVLARCAARPQALPPLLSLYFHTYQMLLQPAEPAHYQALRTGLEAHWRSLSEDAARDLYKYLVNHCANRINAGATAYYDELLGIYQQTLASGALLKGGRIESGQLKNMVGVMIRAGKLEMAERLLENYGPKLNPEAEPLTREYLQAILLYHQGAFSPARKMFETVIRDAEDMFFKIDARLYSWRCSYELGDLDLSEDNYNALRMYLQRDKLFSKPRRDHYMKFVNSLHALWAISQGSPDPRKRHKKLTRLRDTLAQDQGVANIDWLRGKIELEIAKWGE